MFEAESDDDSLFSAHEESTSVPVTAVASDDEVLQLLRKLPSYGRFAVELADHEGMSPESAKGIGIFNLRMMEAFEDLGLIRAWRNARPLQPIIVLSANDDEDFMLEAFKSGATNYLNPGLPPAVLAEILRSYYKMSEAPRLVEIQNAEMIRSMQAEREATEARMAAEGAKAVAQAEAAASRRTKEILDNLTEGFFIVEKDLRIADVTSSSCVEIFGRSIASQALGEALGLSQGREGFLRDGLEQVFDDFMPLEVNVSLLPKRVATELGKTLSLAFHPILDESGSPEKVIIGAMDVTADVQAQARLEELRQVSETLLRILSERESFEEFLADSKRDIEVLRTTDSLTLGKRLLHTLKGNSSVMGLSSVAHAIHDFETELEAEEDCLSLGTYAEAIDKSFEGFLETHRKVLQIDWRSTESRVSLLREDLDRLAAFIMASDGEGRDEALRIIEDTRLRTVQSMLAGFAEIVQQLAERFGKSIEFRLVGGELKLDPEKHGALMKSLVHALRNACDHGIESPEERERLGKRDVGVVSFTFQKQENGELRVTLSDDGRGIQTARVLQKALANGIVREEERETLRVKDVLHLVFHDGLSTAEELSDTSGRGVGMACIRQEVEALGGGIRIASKSGKGTIFELNLP